MSSAGHAMDASRRIQANRRLQKQRRTKFVSSIGSPGKPITTSKVFNYDRFARRSVSSIDASILQARADVRRDQLIGWIKTIAAIVFISMILYWLY